VAITADLFRKYVILAYIAEQAAPSFDDILQHTHIPSSTLKRHMTQIRNDFAVELRFVAVPKGLGRGGYYFIESWGILNRDEFLARFGFLATQPNPLLANGHTA
jgi:hypothetical protein